MNVQPSEAEKATEKATEKAKEERADFLKRVSTTMSNAELAWWLRDQQVDTDTPSHLRKRGVSRRQVLVQLVMAHYDNKREGLYE